MMFPSLQLCPTFSASSAATISSNAHQFEILNCSVRNSCGPATTTLDDGTSWVYITNFQQWGTFPSSCPAVSAVSTHHPVFASHRSLSSSNLFTVLSEPLSLSTTICFCSLQHSRHLVTVFIDAKLQR